MYNLAEMIDRIKIIKRKKGLSNEQLADLSGVPKGTLNKILGSETKDPQISNIIKIANALDVSADYLILGDQKNPPTSKDAGEQEIMESAQKIYQALLSAGYIKEGQELTPAQIDFLDGLSAIISAFFNK